MTEKRKMICPPFIFISKKKKKTITNAKKKVERRNESNYELRITNYVYKVEGRIKRWKAEGGNQSRITNYELRITGSLIEDLCG